MSKAKKLYKSYNWIGEIANKTIIELQKTAGILEEIHNTFFNQFDISSTKFNLLVILYNSSQDGITLSEIGEEMLVTKANITGLVDRLEKQGYVSRKRHSQDRRKVIAAITKQGRKFTEKVIREYKIWSKDVMTILNDEEKKQLLNLFNKLQRGLVSKNLV
ncbi:MarR family winged helix-turn-helix transcriptional regulator [Maledivibacter halophilus]|uniref:MarR family transcriptional regulator, 2-MHQ and catechol-resistance regulon repressor n=1 Tax=Maledivibacter halophilus TaxID=36842 RepID=A0A1T5JZJ0_9FIRM|nr:MarR family transcriptional regulator [Maledivibacter halophilus]SKC56783.1 MarR family transcriptional regulator, 2-MHQ and catechol-resistance regulon repressor [Maledivibacter halophilus]